MKRGDKAAIAEEAVLAKIEAGLNAGKPVLAIALTAEERDTAKQFFLLTDKPTIFACNVKESDLATADANPYVKKVREYVQTHLACEAVVISAQIESDLVDLSPEEGDAFLKELGVRGERHRRADQSHVPSAGICRPTSRQAKRKSAPGRSTSATRRRKRPASFTRISSGVSSRPRRSPTTISCSAARLRRRAKRGFIEWKGKNTSSPTAT